LVDRPPREVIGVQEMGRWVDQRVKEAWRQCGDALPCRRRKGTVALA
jgi:hypothetical protein